MSDLQNFSATPQGGGNTLGTLNQTHLLVLRALNNLNQTIQSVFPLTTLTASKTYDPPSISSGASATTTVTVTGAVLGNMALASFSLDLAGLSLTSYVSAADTVTCVLSNLTGGAVDLASGTLSVRTIA
ncbi:MAG: hypothetical protein KGL39_04565 [Patescibacteria group bacterium]|nr:hypothetical protein [Patescibacteria group bacterium]